MKINRILTNICSQHLAESKEFYTNLFNFKVDFDSDWFVHLISEGRELEIGIMKSDHELVPIEFKGKPNGMYVTIVVDNAESIFYQCQRDASPGIVDRQHREQPRQREYEWIQAESNRVCGLNL